MLNLEAEGLESAQNLLKRLELIAKTKFKATLKSSSRSGNFDSGDILEELNDQGREFNELGSQEAEEVAQAFVDELINSGGLIVEQHSDPKRKAKQVAKKSIKASMEKMMSIVRDHILNAQGPDGGSISNSKLTPAYEKTKTRKHGSAYPIGKATGQLLKDLNNKNNIKVTKGR